MRKQCKLHSKFQVLFSLQIYYFLPQTPPCHQPAEQIYLSQQATLEVVYPSVTFYFWNRCRLLILNFLTYWTKHKHLSVLSHSLFPLMYNLGLPTAPPPQDSLPSAFPNMHFFFATSSKCYHHKPVDNKVKMNRHALQKTKSTLVQGQNINTEVQYIL